MYSSKEHKRRNSDGLIINQIYFYVRPDIMYSSMDIKENIRTKYLLGYYFTYDRILGIHPKNI